MQYINPGLHYSSLSMLETVFFHKSMLYEHLNIVSFAAHAGHLCVLHGLPRVPTAVQPLSGRVKCLKPPCHPLFCGSCISFWLGCLALECHSLKKQWSSCKWDGLGSAICFPHPNPQLTGNRVLENWHITLQGAYCHP